jgi:hypothetical protein
MNGSLPANASVDASQARALKPQRQAPPQPFLETYHVVRGESPCPSLKR